MGFRFHKRIKISKGLGLNISKSGMSPNYRTKRGSLSSKGYSFRTGIPGLTYRKSFKNKGCIIILLLFLMIPLFIVSCSSDSVVDTSNDCKCSDFSSQSAAQAAFNNGSCGDELDRDDDGLACENLPN